MARRGSGPICDPPGTPYFLYNQNYGVEILTKLNALRHEATFTDAILCVGHEEFPCHKNVLSVSSPYFRAMFTSELKESRETRICFNEVSPWTLKRIIDYTYSGRLEINQDNAQEVLSAGNLFQYPDIVEACCSFLKRQLHSSNCLGIEYFAHIHSCQKLENEAHAYALENFSVVIDSDEFLDLPLDRVMLYISNDHIDVRNEEKVYHAIRRWLNYDPDERKPFLPQLLEQVRLPIMGLQNLRLLESDQLLQGCHKGLQMIREAQKNHQISNERPEHRRSSLPAIIHPRPSTVAKEVIIVISGINSYITPSVEMYDTQKDRWFSLPDLPRLVSWFSVCTVSNSILIMGGICDGHVVDTVWKFDVVLRLWTEVARMPEPRARHACAVLYDRVYVCGGVKGDGNQLVESIDCYDIYNNSWSKAGQSENPRKQARIVPFKNSLLEIGGIQGEAMVNTIDTYICTGGDKLKHSGEQYLLPSRIQFAQILVLNGIFYIIWEDTKKMLALDPLKRTFQPLPDMNFPRIHCSTTVLNGKLYVSGGLIDSKPTRLVESFDPVLKRWKKERSMSEERAYHGCITLQMC